MAKVQYLTSSSQAMLHCNNELTLESGELKQRLT